MYLPVHQAPVHRASLDPRDCVLVDLQPECPTACASTDRDLAGTCGSLQPMLGVLTRGYGRELCELINGLLPQRPIAVLPGFPGRAAAQSPSSPDPGACRSSRA